MVFSELNLSEGEYKLLGFRKVLSRAKTVAKTKEAQVKTAISEKIIYTVIH